MGCQELHRPQSHGGKCCRGISGHLFAQGQWPVESLRPASTSKAHGRAILQHDAPLHGQGQGEWGVQGRCIPQKGEPGQAAGGQEARTSVLSQVLQQSPPRLAGVQAPWRPCRSWSPRQICKTSSCLKSGLGRRDRRLLSKANDCSNIEIAHEQYTIKNCREARKIARVESQTAATATCQGHLNDEDPKPTATRARAS